MLELIGARVERPIGRQLLSGTEDPVENWARVTGKPGVCMTTSGPGATNLLTGIIGCAEMSLDLLPGIGGESALSQALELSWRLHLPTAVKPLVKAWPRSLAPQLAFLGLDYLVLSAYRDGLQRRLP